jgi:hypothetical protein
MPIDDDDYSALGLYILDAEGNPVPEPDLFRWALWQERAYQDGSRQVARDELADGHWVSTVFLGIDHGHAWANSRARPILYETMVFNDCGSLDEDWASDRYATREEALEGHAAALTELKLHLAQTGEKEEEREK